jgi:isopenicillin N synthase-like dioxygenase
MNILILLWQIMTNGIYRSIEHRATANSEKERISVAAFHNIQMGRDLGPARSLVILLKVLHCTKQLLLKNMSKDTLQAR